MDSKKTASQVRKDLIALRKNNPGKKIVFCSGSFDLTHAGHVLFFEACKKLGDILVVNLGSDRALRLTKTPDRPIVNEHMRWKLVSSLKQVDYCFIDRAKNSHMVDSLDVHFTALKPDIYAVNNDIKKLAESKAIARKNRTKIVILDRTCPPEFMAVSTTKIIDKIKRLG